MALTGAFVPLKKNLYILDNSELPTLLLEALSCPNVTLDAQRNVFFLFQFGVNELDWSAQSLDLEKKECIVQMKTEMKDVFEGICQPAAVILPFPLFGLEF